MLYKIATDTIWTQWYVVKADSQEEAIKKVLDGEVETIAESGEFLWETEKVAYVGEIKSEATKPDQTIES